MIEDEDFMCVALELAAQAAAAGEVPIGAIAVRDNVIVAKGANRVEEIHSVSAHAEFEVLHQLEKLTGDWRMNDFTIYVTKEPCPMCAGMLVNARFRRIVFGAPDPAGGGCGGAVAIPKLPGLLWHPEVVGGVLAEPALALLRDFFRNRRKGKIL